jgi:hypothetical protein
MANPSNRVGLAHTLQSGLQTIWASRPSWNGRAVAALLLGIGGMGLLAVWAIFRSRRAAEPELQFSAEEIAQFTQFSHRSPTGYAIVTYSPAFRQYAQGVFEFPWNVLPYAIADYPDVQIDFSHNGSVFTSQSFTSEDACCSCFLRNMPYQENVEVTIKMTDKKGASKEIKTQFSVKHPVGVYSMDRNQKCSASPRHLPVPFSNTSGEKSLEYPLDITIMPDRKARLVYETVSSPRPLKIENQSAHDCLVTFELSYKGPISSSQSMVLDMYVHRRSTVHATQAAIEKTWKVAYAAKIAVPSFTPSFNLTQIHYTFFEKAGK